MIGLDDSNRLYKIGGVSALVISLLYVITGVITGVSYSTSPVPSDVTGWFALFQSHPLLGFVYLGVQDAVIAILCVPLILALYQVVKETSRSWAFLASLFAVIGITIYLSMHISFSVFSLSSLYARAATEARRAAILAGGQALLLDPRGGYGMAIVWASALILSVLMLRGKTFSRIASIAGIAGFLFLLVGLTAPAGYTNIDPLTATEATITGLSIAGGGLLSLIWYILVGLRLLKYAGSDLQQAKRLSQQPGFSR